MRHRLRVLALVVTLLLLTACNRGDVEEAPTPTPTPTPTVDETPATPTPDGPEGSDEVTAWFVREHESGLWVEPETVVLDEPAVGVLAAAVDAMVAGETANPDLTTLVPPGTEVLGVNIEDRVAIVDLSGNVAAAGGASSQEGAFAQQLAHTAAQFDTVDAVRLLLDGEPIDELWGHFDWSEPLRPERDSVSRIIIEHPRWGASEPVGTVTATGTSVTFEATVELRLIGPDGEVVEETFTTAAQPDLGEHGPWEHSFTVSTPGTWTIEAIEPDPSGGEGRPPFVTSVRFEAS